MCSRSVNDPYSLAQGITPIQTNPMTKPPEAEMDVYKAPINPSPSNALFATPNGLMVDAESVAALRKGMAVPDKMVPGKYTLSFESPRSMIQIPEDADRLSLVPTKWSGQFQEVILQRAEGLGTNITLDWPEGLTVNGIEGPSYQLYGPSNHISLVRHSENEWMVTTVDLPYSGTIDLLDTAYGLVQGVMDEADQLAATIDEGKTTLQSMIVVNEDANLAKELAEQAAINATNNANAAQVAKVLSEEAASNAQINARNAETWTVLAGFTPTIVGESAVVLDTDTGTHTDPSTSAVVQNSGTYRAYGTSIGNWTRIGDTGLSEVRADTRTLLGQFGVRSGPGILIALTDLVGHRTWIEARSTDGRMTDRAAKIVAEDVAPFLNFAPEPEVEAFTALPPVSGPTIGAVPRGSFYIRPNAKRGFPVVANRRSISGWGSSTIGQFNGRFRSMFLGMNPNSEYYNGAKGGETSLHIFGRLGSRPLELTFPSNTIQASGAAVVTVSNCHASASMLAYVGTVEASDGTLIEGTLSSSGTQFTFTRTTVGVAKSVAADTPMIPTVGLQHRSDVLILSAGKNDLDVYGISDDDIIQRTIDAIEWTAPLFKSVVVMGIFPNTFTPNDSAGNILRGRISYINQAWKEFVGPCFLDLGEWLASSRAWTQTGITPTSEDLAEQALRNKPPSLSDVVGGLPDPYHMNGSALDAFRTHEAAPFFNNLALVAE